VLSNGSFIEVKRSCFDFNTQKLKQWLLGNEKPFQNKNLKQSSL
jgi:hypothetical protein